MGVLRLALVALAITAASAQPGGARVFAQQGCIEKVGRAAGAAPEATALAAPRPVCAAETQQAPKIADPALTARSQEKPARLGRFRAHHGAGVARGRPCPSLSRITTGVTQTDLLTRGLSPGAEPRETGARHASPPPAAPWQAGHTLAGRRPTEPPPRHSRSAPPSTLPHTRPHSNPTPQVPRTPADLMATPRTKSIDVAWNSPSGDACVSDWVTGG